MSKIIIVSKNILKRIFKKPTGFILYILLPVVVVFGVFALFSGSSNAEFTVGICDMSNTPSSNYIISRIENNHDYITEKVEYDKADSFITSGQGSLVLVLKDGFESDIFERRDPIVVIKSIKNDKLTEFIKNLINIEVSNLILLSESVNKSKLDYEQALIDFSLEEQISLSLVSVSDDYVKKSAGVDAIGMYLMIMMLNAFMITSVIIDEKNNGTYNRIGIAPVNSKIYSIANILSGGIIIIIQIVLVIILLNFVLGIGFNVSIVELFVTLLTFGLCSISMGVFVATIARTSNSASAIMTLVVTPSCMLAGCFWPIELMPEILKKLAYITPQRWALDVFINKSSFIPGIAVLAAFTMLFFVASIFNTIRLNRKV